jgi:hypothetical protein
MFVNGKSVSKRLTLAIVLIGFVLLSLTSFAMSSGHWKPAQSTFGCPSSGFTSGCGGDQICADWDVDGEPLVTCCIDPQYLGSTSFGACG